MDLGEGMGENMVISMLSKRLAGRKGDRGQSNNLKIMQSSCMNLSNCDANFTSIFLELVGKTLIYEERERHAAY